MTFAESVFRIGCATVTWLVSYAHCLTLAIVPLVPCARPDNDPFFASFALALTLVPLLALVSFGLPFRAQLRWLVLPLALLVPLALRGVLPYLSPSAVAHAHACSAASGLAAAGEPQLWHQLWAPAQLLVLAVLAWQGLRFWRGGAHAMRPV